MKATLAMLACLSMVGLVTAATVEGNNTAVVIQKTATPSETGFQFLCVPVAPLDITGGNSGTLTLEAMLPPALYPTGTKISLAADSGKTTAHYKINETNGVKSWVTEDTEETPSNGLTLTPGEVFWLNTKGAKGDLFGGLFGDNTSSASLTEAEATTDTVVFCGQAMTAAAVTGDPGFVKAAGNVASEAKKLTDMIAGASEGDILFVIAEGKADYKQYHYSNSTWWKPQENNVNGGAMVEVEDTDVIAAGEAFYYYDAE